MRWSERIAWGLIGLLLLLALAVPFLIDLVLGSVILVFALAVIGWVYGVRKRHVETTLREIAAETGMEVEPHILTYSAVQGVYLGHPTRIEIATSHDFGVGAVTTAATGMNVAAADIRNFTRIRMRPSCSEDVAERWPAEPAGDETVVDLPMVGAASKDLMHGLARAISEAADRRER